MVNYFRTRAIVIIVFFLLSLLLSTVYIYTAYGLPEFKFLFHQDTLIQWVAMTLLTTIWGVAFFHMFKRMEVNDLFRALVSFPIGFLMGVFTHWCLEFWIEFLSAYAR